MKKKKLLMIDLIDWLLSPVLC